MEEQIFLDWLEQKGLRLSAQQRQGALCGDGAHLIVATPGSGKTTVVLCRTARLLRQGVPAPRILTLTFGKQSQIDLERRFAARFPELPAPRFSTFHALCLRILRRYAALTGGQPFDLMPDGAGLVRALLQRQGAGFVAEETLQAALSQLEYAAGRMLDDEAASRLAVEGCDFARLHREYRQAKREMRRMDFGDLLTFAHRALERRPDLLAECRGAWSYVQVDEAQDTSPVQQRLADLLAGPQGNLFVVGDEDQSIYGFRGADPEYLMSFEAQHPGARVLYMEENFRCCPEVVAAANRVVAYNAYRRPKNMRAAPRTPGGTADREELRDWSAQADYVCRRAQELAPGRTLGVLFRNNDSAPALCGALLRAGIRPALSRRDGKPGLFGHYVLRNLRSLIRLSYNPCDGEAFYDVHNRIRRGLPRFAVERARRSGEDVFALLCRLPELSAADRDAVERRAERVAEYKTLRAYDAVSRMIEDFYLDGRGANTAKTDALLSLAMGVNTLDDYAARLDEIELWMDSERPGDSGVTLSTIHAAKGLEYDEVILADAQEGVLPASVADDTPEQRRALEEETRLMYVAVTRARRRFTLLTASHSHGAPCGPSIFADRLFPPVNAPRKALPPALRVNRGGLFRPAAAVKGPAPGEDWLGRQVRHRVFGPGEVLAVRGGVAEVRFADGVRALDLRVCQQSGALRLCEKTIRDG